MCGCGKTPCECGVTSILDGFRKCECGAAESCFVCQMPPSFKGELLDLELKLRDTERSLRVAVAEDGKTQVFEMLQRDRNEQRDRIKVLEIQLADLKTRNAWQSEQITLFIKYGHREGGTIQEAIDNVRVMLSDVRESRDVLEFITHMENLPVARTGPNETKALSDIARAVIEQYRLVKDSRAKAENSVIAFLGAKERAEVLAARQQVELDKQAAALTSLTARHETLQADHELQLGVNAQLRGMLAKDVGVEAALAVGEAQQ